jgi:hypothetical protein
VKIQVCRVIKNTFGLDESTDPFHTIISPLRFAQHDMQETNYHRLVLPLALILVPALKGYSPAKTKQKNNLLKNS